MQPPMNDALRGRTLDVLTERICREVRRPDHLAIAIALDDSPLRIVEDELRLTLGPDDPLARLTWLTRAP